MSKYLRHRIRLRRRHISAAEATATGSPEELPSIQKCCRLPVASRARGIAKRRNIRSENTEQHVLLRSHLSGGPEHHRCIRVTVRHRLRQKHHRHRRRPHRHPVAKRMFSVLQQLRRLRGRQLLGPPRAVQREPGPRPQLLPEARYRQSRVHHLQPRRFICEKNLPLNGLTKKIKFVFLPLTFFFFGGSMGKSRFSWPHRMRRRDARGVWACNSYVDQK